MAYPIFKNKHLHEALIKPGEYVTYKKINKKLPKKYILFYSGSVLNYIKKNYNLKKIKIYSNLIIFLYKDIGFVKIPGIGSPMAVTLLEELIALGGNVFLNLGFAGGLEKKGIFLCNKAIRDEGASYYYITHGKMIYPDLKLTKKFGDFLKKNKVDYKVRATWTIDTPYRETKKEVEHFAKGGVSTVEMETSALFVVAKYRKTKIASTFVVSDLLGKKWVPEFHRVDVKKQLNKLVDFGAEFLTKSKV